MEESVQVKKTEPVQEPVSAIALFLAQYEYLRKYIRIGLQAKPFVFILDTEYQTSEKNGVITVFAKKDISKSQMRATEWIRLSKEIADNESRIENVQATLDDLNASVKQVEGKRSLLEKIDKEAQPELYDAMFNELVVLEDALGDYEPFKEQYNSLIKECKSKIKDAEKSLKSLPPSRESETFEFLVSDFKNIVD
jgi:chromosome segregation ATPase